MTYRRILHGAKFWFWVALFLAYSAGTVSLLAHDAQLHRVRHEQMQAVSVMVPMPFTQGFTGQHGGRPGCSR